MTTGVIMPKLGLLMTEGVVVKWLVANGLPVEKNMPIVTIMTKKITYQVVAPTDGILHHAAQVNAKLLIGEPLAFVTTPGEPVPTLPQKTPVAQSETPYAPSYDASPSAKPIPYRFVMASPWARYLGRELGIDVAELKGTGPNGCVIGRDVLNFNGQRNRAAAQGRPKSLTPVEVSPSARLVPFTGMRRIIAERMTESLHTMAQATLNAEVDVTPLLRALKKTHPLVPLTHTDVIIKAVALALKTHPRLNAILLGDEIELIEDVHIGIAVQLEDGLLVPVVRDADQRTVVEIAAETHRLTEAARTGTLTVDDATGSTFTVTDLGAEGIDFFVPIINPPEAAILGIGRITKRPAIFNRRIVSRFMLMLCLAFDHRVVDGAPAAAFLRTMATLLSHPHDLLGPGE